ncbi:MAG TPA: DNA polymerase ligase N-terminal domain-containing protein [Gemmataceae bacterium]|nr:DNA polymerase ligase N-terminal domain-containing protein [Gemmataceae bacterium]
MPCFVILEHDHPFLHWDLMLETGDVLRTWRLLEAPEPGKTIAAEALGDHRRMYLDYEGPVSGGRGRVKRWDAGSFEWTKDQLNQVVIRLAGQRLRGAATLKLGDRGKWAFQLQ